MRNNIIIAGVPRAGKSTISNLLSKRYGYQHVSMDSIIAGFEKILGVKSILMGFGLGSDAIHSPNENYKVEHFLKGIETIPYFYKFYGEMMNA